MLSFPTTMNSVTVTLDCIDFVFALTIIAILAYKWFNDIQQVKYEYENKITEYQNKITEYQNKITEHKNEIDILTRFHKYKRYCVHYLRYILNTNHILYEVISLKEFEARY